MAASVVRSRVGRHGSHRSQTGETAPDFRLEDQNGAQQTLKSVMGPKGLMLVFYRSADW